MHKNKLIPENKVGKENNLSETVDLDTREQAEVLFKKASNRMLNPSLWHKLAGALSAEFELVDLEEKPLKRNATSGDYIKIDLPAPGPSLGKGFDWVKVELVDYIHDDNQDQCSMKLIPAQEPLENNTDVAHFFKQNASSTFIIHRVGNKVIASYHGRNEEPNTSTESTVDNIRNAVVATAAIAGISEIQWHTLIKAFVSDDNKE